MQLSVLTFIIALPLLTGIVILLLPEREKNAPRMLALISGLITLALSGWVYANYDITAGGYQFVEKQPGCQLWEFLIMLVLTASACRWCYWPALSPLAVLPSPGILTNVPANSLLFSCSWRPVFLVFSVHWICSCCFSSLNWPSSLNT